MSKPNPRRGAKSSSRRQPRDTEKDESSDRTGPSRSAASNAASKSHTPTEKDTKDETGETSTDKKDPKSTDDTAAGAAAPPAPKPQSAGATMRDAGQKLLNLTMKQEWSSIDPVLKQLEKIVTNSGGELKPLTGVMDPVSIMKENRKMNKFFFVSSICSRMIRWRNFGPRQANHSESCGIFLRTTQPKQKKK